MSEQPTEQLSLYQIEDCIKIKGIWMKGKMILLSQANFLRHKKPRKKLRA